MAWSLAVSRPLLLFALLAASAAPVYADGDAVYWGAHIDGTPANAGLIDSLQAQAGKGASIIEWGEPWQHAGTYQAFQTSYFQQVRDRGSIPALDWGSWDFCCGETQPQFRLASIINGTHDAYLRQWASAAAAWGHPFFLRFDPEMNGWWHPWSEQTNGNQPGEFVRAWRHVVDIFRQQGATNATWVWCPNIVGPRSTPMDELYPGDNYVDWACLDGYNFGLDRGNAWQTFTEVFTGSWFNANYNSYQLVQEAAPGKPIMIGETASSERGGSKSAWISDMLVNQLPQSFPNVGAFIWFDWNGDDPSLHWEINSSPAAESAFRSGIASPYYLDNQFAALGSGPIPVRRSMFAPAAVPPTEITQPATESEPDAVQPVTGDQTAAFEPLSSTDEAADDAADDSDAGADP